VDIPSFLRMYPPFDELDDEQLANVVRHTHIEFYPAGAEIVRRAAAPSEFLYVVRKGLVHAVDGDQVADVLGEGEFFGFVSIFTGLEAAFTILAIEDTICYLIDQEIATEVMSTRRGLAFLAGSLRRREVSVLEGPEREAVDAWAAPVSRLIRREPLTIGADATAQEAAAMMTRERISSVLVRGDGEVGILTDRDLRAKLVASGRGPGTRVGELMSAPLISVPPGTSSGEVLTLMFERGIHHVPVIGDGERLVGIVTDTDLMGLEQWKPFALKSELERAPDEQTAIEVAGRLPQMFVKLVEADVQPLDVAHAVAVTHDTLARRLLELGIEEFGEPPCPWAWLALGSQARQEQGLATDQDNAFVVGCDDASFAEADRYFAQLTAFVIDRIERAGIPRCRDGVVASNPEWRGTIGAWEERFRDRVRRPTQAGRTVVAIAFDARRVAGSLDVEPTFEDAIRRSVEEDGSVRQLALQAVSTRPPVGLLKEAIEDPTGQRVAPLDVKGVGIAPITDLARVLAVEAGIPQTGTLRRLREAAARGLLSDETHAGLSEAFGLLWQIRVETQARAVERGAPPDDAVHPAWLGPLTRQALRDAFRLIEDAQDRLATRLDIRR
jgi:CBS domain-containing protein